MIERLIICEHLIGCCRSKNGAGSTSCFTCANNRARNREVDYYVEAKDNPIPAECPKLHYDGPAEQTAGYKCPVCGKFTNPYLMEDCRCSSCGYKLNV